MSSTGAQKHVLHKIYACSDIADRQHGKVVTCRNKNTFSSVCTWVASYDIGNLKIEQDFYLSLISK